MRRDLKSFDKMIFVIFPEIFPTVCFQILKGVMMKFLKISNDYIVSNNNYSNYMKYLIQNKDKIPPHLYETFTSDWYYGAQDYKCPHDSWIDSIEINEKKIDDDRANSSIEINLVLLNAYHNYNIIYRYEDVKKYQINLIDKSKYGNWAHGV